MLFILLLALPLVSGSDVVDCYSCFESHHGTAPPQYSEVIKGFGSSESCTRGMQPTQCDVEACLSAVYKLKLDVDSSTVAHTMRVYGCGTTLMQENICSDMNTTVNVINIVGLGVAMERCSIVKCSDSGCNVPQIVITETGPTVAPWNPVDLLPEGNGTTTRPADDTADVSPPNTNATVNSTTVTDITTTAENRTVIIEDSTTDLNITNVTEEEEEGPMEEVINETITDGVINATVEDVDNGNATSVDVEEVDVENDVDVDVDVDDDDDVVDGGNSTDGSNSTEQTVHSSSALLVPGVVSIVMFLWCL